MNSKDFQDITLPASHLEIGMHVVGIDRPWEETTFLLQSFIIQSQQDIHELQAQCQFVTIQARIDTIPSKSNPITTPKPSAPNAKNATGKKPVMSAPSSEKRVKYINQVSFEKAVESSRMTFDSARNLAANIMDGLRVGRSLDMNECRKQVEDVVDNVISNKDALRFLSMIKNKDEYTAEHSMNVCILCATFARHLGLLDYEIKIVALCGLLHDVGKCKIPLEVLNKPGRFTKEEAFIMSEHTNYGRNILMSTTGEQRHAVDVAHSHHERVDGKGYPRCLSANQIPYYAKIIAIVDAYDAMTSERCYGKPKTSYLALKIIMENAGTQFDRTLSKDFVDCIGFYSAGCLVELKTEELAVIVKANEEKNERPLLLVVTNKDKTKRKKPVLADLVQPKFEHLAIKQEMPNGSHGIDVKNYISKKLFG